jgi:hypothetical protein
MPGALAWAKLGPKANLFDPSSGAHAYSVYGTAAFRPLGQFPTSEPHTVERWSRHSCSASNASANQRRHDACAMDLSLVLNFNHAQPFLLDGSSVLGRLSSSPTSSKHPIPPKIRPRWALKTDGICGEHHRRQVRDGRQNHHARHDHPRGDHRNRRRVVELDMASDCWSLRSSASS